MATKQQIGVVVSATGAKEYERQLKLLTQYTKEWKSETDKLTSSFDKNEKSMTNVVKERDALEKEIDSLNKVLKLQQDRWAELATTMSTTPTENQQMEFSKLRTSINQTETKINDLKTRLKELPKDNFFARKEYITNTENLAHKTDTLAAKTKALDSAMALNGKTMGGIKSKKALLASQIDTLSKKLEAQKKRYGELRIEMLNNPSDQTKQDFHELGEEIYNTTSEVNGLKKSFKDLEQENGFTLFMDAFEQGGNKTGEYMKKIGDGMSKYVTLPIVGGFVASVKEAADFESAFTGVRKTVEGTDEELASLRDELMKIPLSTASSTEEVMAVAEAAGQLNVPINRIADFTKTIIMLGDSTNISSDEGATSIARFMNIVGTDLTKGTKPVDRFASSLVALGNQTATDEESILALAMRLASAGNLAGLSTPDILGLSAAMSAVGLTAEAGGTAMSTTLQLIHKGVASGGEDLEKFAAVAGTTAEDFARTWRENPIDALQQLLIGMSHLSEDGGADLLQFMEDVGWSGIRQSDTMRRLTFDYDGVSEAVRIANENFQTNEENIYGVNAVTKEASKRYEDLDSKVSQFKESVKQLAAAFGDEIIPILKPIVDDLTEMIKGFAGLDDKTKKNILSFAGLFAVIGPILSIGGNLLIWTSQLKDAFGNLKGAEGVAGATESIAGKGGFIEGLKTVGKTVTEKVIPTITDTVPGALGFTLVTLAGCFLGARAAATKMDEKMYESAEACEYVATRYHWSEEKVNEFGYTWDENGHLVALASQNMTSIVESEHADLLQDVDTMKNVWRDKAKEMAKNQTKAITDESPNVQSATYQMVKTGIEDQVGSTAANMSKYGSEVGNNFASGIRSAIGAVASAASRIASTVASYLHFSEPDVGALSNFHTFMPDMMSEMAMGIKDNAYLVENALSNVSQGMANQLGGGQSYNYGGVNIILNVPQGANGYQMVDEIENALAQRTMRRKAVFN